MSEAQQSRDIPSTTGDHLSSRSTAVLRQMGYIGLATATATATLVAAPRAWQYLEERNTTCGTADMVHSDSEYRIGGPDGAVGWAAWRPDEVKLRDYDSLLGSYTHSLSTGELPSTVKLQGVGYLVEATVDEAGEVQTVKLTCQED